MTSAYSFVLILLADVVLIVIGFIHALRIWTVARYLTGARQKAHGNIHFEDAYPNIFVLIPLLRESNILDNMFAWLTRLQYPTEKLKIVLITTEREYETGPDKVHDTVAGVQSHIGKFRARKDNRFIHLHYPQMQGVKSDQLNFAVRKLRDAFPTEFNNKTYLGVYDADSVTPPDVLNILAHQAVLGQYQNLYQQPTWYFKNYDQLPNSIAGQLARSFAWLQNAFALYHEAHLLIDQAERKELTKMEYGVGHGLFVRWSFLEKIGLFPSPIEDTRLGHIASYLGEKLYLLPVFDAAEVAVGISRQIQQSSIWFTGEAFVVEDLRIARQIGKVPPLRALRLLCYKLYRNTVWICRPFLLAVAVIATASVNHFILAGAVLFMYLYLPLLTLWTLNGKFRIFAIEQQNKMADSLGSFLVSAIFAPAEFFIMSLGPLLGLIRFMNFRLNIKQLNLSKTERPTHE